MQENRKLVTIQYSLDGISRRKRTLEEEGWAKHDDAYPVELGLRR